MCLIDRHLQVFLAILYIHIHTHIVSVLISSIHRSRKRPMFDLYLGHPDNINQRDVLLFGHRPILLLL